MDNKCAFDCGDSCKAMKEKICIGCSFYKTQEELEDGRDKAAVAVANLEPKLKNHIRKKYYGGRRAFKDEWEKC